MSKYRKGRINEAIAQELSVALREASDPVIVSSFVSVTRAEAAPDLKIAKIYFSHLSGEEKEVKRALERATGMLRRHLAQTLNLRITPELIYAPDHSGAHGARISELLNQIHKEDAARAEKETAKDKGLDNDDSV
jgi:ribosome-binding factor A